MSKLLRLSLLAVLVLIVPSCAQAPEASAIKITCRDGAIATIEPERFGVLLITRPGNEKMVPWELETAGCPEDLSRVEIRFTRTSPFGKEPADKELVVPELPTPLPKSLLLINRGINMREEAQIGGEHRYELLFLDAEGKVLSKQVGYISVRVIAPVLDTSSLIVAGVVLVLLFWLLRRRLFAKLLSAQ